MTRDEIVDNMWGLMVAHGEQQARLITKVLMPGRRAFAAFLLRKEPNWKALMDEPIMIGAKYVDEPDVAPAPPEVIEVVHRYLRREQPDPKVGAVWEPPSITENLGDTGRIRVSWTPWLQNDTSHTRDENAPIIDYPIAGLKLASAVLYEGLLCTTGNPPAWAMPQWFYHGASIWNRCNFLGGLQVLLYRQRGRRDGWLKRRFRIEKE